MSRHLRNEGMTWLTISLAVVGLLVSAGSAIADQDIGNTGLVRAALPRVDADGDGFAEPTNCAHPHGSDGVLFDPNVEFGLLRDNTWTNMNPDEHPIARYYFAMAADKIEHKAVLFGGLGYVDSLGDYHSLNDTWTYDLSANTWERANPDVSPPARYGHEMTYSEEDGVVVLFGGVDPYHEPDMAYDDIWLYRTAEDQWVEVELTTAIPARGFHSLAYDGQHDRIVVFGGYNWLTGQWFNDTWTHAIGDDFCVNQNPGTRPSVRNSHRTSYDEQEGLTILFGGWFPPNELSETWAYDLGANTWTRMYPAVSPPARMSFGMTYDDVSDKTMLFGGGRMPPLLNDTWTYDPATNEWTDMCPDVSPLPRHRLPLAFQDGAAILFGGYSAGGQLGDTWSYQPPTAGIEDPGEIWPRTASAWLESVQNPVRDKAVVAYRLPVVAEISLRIFDSTGRLVRTLAAGPQGTGYHELVWDGRDAAGKSVQAGTYFGRIQGGGLQETQKIVIVR